MKTDRMGDARGSSELEIVVGRRSWGNIFWWKTKPRAKPEEDPAYKESSVKSFCFCFSSLAEPVAAARSGQGRAVFLARRERTLDGEDRCESMSAGGKDLFSSMQEMCYHGGKDE